MRDQPTPEQTPERIAEKFFAARRVESLLDEELMRAFGAAVTSEGLTMAGTPYLETDVDTWPCGHMVYDDYDSSFELWGIADAEWMPTVAQLNAALDLGFDRCWLVYRDGTERYCIRDRIGEKKPSHGSRVSEEKYLLAKAARERDALTATLAHLTQEQEETRERHTIQLAAISTATLSNTHESAAKWNTLDRDNPYWTAAYMDVCTAIQREIRWRERAEQAEATLARVKALSGDLLCAVTLARCGEWGCANEGATIMPREWRCPPCAVYAALVPTQEAK